MVEKLKRYKVPLAITGAIILALLAALIFGLYRDASVGTGEVFITNVTDTAFTVVWNSDEPYSKELIYQEADKSWIPVLTQITGNTALDDRQVNAVFFNEESSNNSKNSRYTHHITIGGLKPQTEYSFRIKGTIIGKRLEISKVTTKPLREDLTTPNPGYGSTRGVDPRDAVIIVKHAARPDEFLSTPIAINETYSFDLNTLFPEGTVDATQLNAYLLSNNYILAPYTYQNPEAKPFETLVSTDSATGVPVIVGQVPEVKEPSPEPTPEPTDPGDDESDGDADGDSAESEDDPYADDYEVSGSPATDLPESVVEDLPEETDGLDEQEDLAGVPGGPSTPDDDDGGSDDGGVIGDPNAPQQPLPPDEVGGQPGRSVDVGRPIFALQDRDGNPASEPTETPTQPNNPAPQQPSQQPPPAQQPVCISPLDRDEYYHVGPSGEQELAQVLTGGLIKSAQAQNNSTTPAEFITVRQSGRVAFFENGDRIAEKDIVLNQNENSVAVRIYYDDNGNGEKDEFEVYMESYTEVSFESEASAIKYDLNAGWNLINIPMVDTRPRNPINTGKKLLQYWESQGAEIKHVARFKNGRFDFASKRESGKYYDGDFALVPGEALFVFSLKYDSTVTFSGNEFSESVPLEFTNGWNLVGIHTAGQEYTSEELIAAMEQQGLVISTVSKFENGIYNSVVKDEGIIFGNNFKIIKTRGYFIRVEQGTEELFTP